MRRISIGFSDSEYMVLSEIARAHGGNLSNAARSLLHRETIIKSITDTVAAELKSAIAPILESSESVLKNQELVAGALAGVGTMQPTLSAEDAAKAVEAADKASRDGGFGGLNKGQREALYTLLTSLDRMILIQGYAGTAKTNAVLANYTKIMTEKGFEVVAMAPTSSAAETLGKAIGAEHKTLTGALLSLQSSFAKGEKPEKPQVWLLDEASLACTADLNSLTKLAGWAGARVLPTGDVKQLGSVGAGSGFRQMQEVGVKTLILDEIVRQKNKYAKGAVYDSIKGEAAAALLKIDKSGEVKEIQIKNEDGKIDHEASRAARVETIAKDYTSQTRQERAQSIIVAPGTDDREQINTRIRELLQAKGELGEDHSAMVLDGRKLGKAESREAQFYTAGDLVSFRKGYQQKGIKANDYLTIKAVNIETNIVTLQTKSGRELDWNPRQWGASSAASFASVGKKLAVGDVLKFTKNDKSLAVNNGDTTTVTKLENGKAEVTTEKGKKLTLDLANPAHQHIVHAYAQTVFAAQGRTSGAVFVHAESHRRNLINAQSLYVGISRATDRIVIYTDDREKLIAAMQERTGQKLTALEMGQIKVSMHEQFKSMDKETPPEQRHEREEMIRG